MTARIYALRAEADQGVVDLAEEVRQRLDDAGVRSSELHDGVFEVASTICEELAAAHPNDREAINAEYAAANELVAGELKDQVLVLCAFHRTHEAVRAKLQELVRVDIGSGRPSAPSP